MKQTLKNMRIRKWMGVLFAAVLMTALGAQTALASTDYVKSISITLDVAPVPGEVFQPFIMDIQVIRAMR